MNLVNDPWIPVIRNNGHYNKVSLAGLFKNAENIDDLSADPPQRIALMRLLICITQAALNGPADEEDWFYCKNRISPQCLSYLKTWQNAFELRGPKPFMQIADLTVDEGNEAVVDKLDCRLSSGNKPTLFDHPAKPGGRVLNDEENALNLLTYLNFSPGGKVGQANWNGKKFSEATFAAPCIKYAHTFIRSKNILDSLYFNLLTRNGDTKSVEMMPNGRWGQPVWERFPESTDDHEAFENASRTYLGRLVPLSRFIKLGDKNSAKCIIGPTHKSYKIEHLPAFREPSATVVQNHKAIEYYLPVSSEKHIWRKLGSLLSLHRVSTGTGGALPLGGLLALYNEFPDSLIDIWVGGLETGAQAAKINDMLEWTLRVPVRQLYDACLQKFQNGVSLAESAENKLKNGIKTYCSDLGIDNKTGRTSRGTSFFWSAMDREHGILIKDANNSKIPLGQRWYPTVRKAMEQAFEQSCPHETPRQIEAFALGFKELRLKKPEE